MAEYIGRETIIKVIKDYGKGASSDGLTALDPVEDIVMIAKAIEWLPAADVEPVVHAQWLTTDAFPHRLFCSECSATAIPNVEYLTRWGMKYKFCPNCGAKMDDVSE